MEEIIQKVSEINHDGLLLVSPIPPSVNHYMNYRTVIKNGRPVAISYKPKDVVQYQKMFTAYVTEEAKKQGWNQEIDPNRHFYIDTVFFFPEKRMDANNYFKVMLDAITEAKVIWKDDNVTCERVQAIYYDASNPHVELYIHPTDYIGIFRDMSQREEFITRCVDCTRYKRNCSLLRKATDGRVQSEIVDGVCSKFKRKNNVGG